jgi:hypothetical protein
VKATADHDRWWRTLPAQGGDRGFGVLHLAEYVAHYNEHRPHRALGQQAPGTFGVLPDPIDEPDPAQLRRNEILGGVINEYRLLA